jgi:hypothetical protein
VTEVTDQSINSSFRNDYVARQTIVCFHLLIVEDLIVHDIFNDN